MKTQSHILNQHHLKLWNNFMFMKHLWTLTGLINILPKLSSGTIEARSGIVVRNHMSVNAF